MIQKPAQSPFEVAYPSEVCPVNVHTEWQPLEEVIVGVIDGAQVPDWHVSVAATIPPRNHSFFQNNGGRPFPADQIHRAKIELESLASFLIREGITVRRPSPELQDRAFITPFFSSSGAFYAAMPRDCLFAVGNTIIEPPMAWRSRYFETFAFRSILKDYFERGANWIAAPRPTLADDLYRADHSLSSDTFESVVTEFEPVFDAADFVRLGRDIVGQLSHVTNWSGIEWLKRILGPQYRVHIYEFDDSAPMHIDTTILPLAPGRVLVNPDWTSRLPDIFAGWEVLSPPRSVLADSHPLYMTSKWISMNILMLDERRVVVEAEEEPLIQALLRWNFEPIPLPFKHFQTFGGSFHCATLDVRRKGGLESYV